MKSYRNKFMNKLNIGHMNKVKRAAQFIIIAAAVGLFLPACYTTDLKFQKQQSAGEEAVNPVQMVNFSSMWFGFFPKTEPVHPVCNQGQVLDKITFGMDYADNIIHFFIGGIYTRRNVIVFCK